MAVMPKSRNERFHDRFSARYDQTYDTPYWEFIRARLWQLVKPLRPRDTSARVVDLGCGTGWWGLRMARAGFRTTFVDLSAKMLERARINAQQAGVTERCTFVKADLADLGELPQEGLPAGGAQLAMAMGDPISLSATPDTAVRQTARLLAQGGTFCGTVDNFYAALDYHLDKGLDEIERFIQSGVTEWLTHDPAERFPTQTFTPDRLRLMLTSAGFSTPRMVCYTVLALRAHPELLSTSENRRKLLALEQRLSQDPACAGRTAHLFFCTQYSGK